MKQTSIPLYTQHTHNNNKPQKLLGIIEPIKKKTETNQPNKKQCLYLRENSMSVLVGELVRVI